MAKKTANEGMEGTIAKIQEQLNSLEKKLDLILGRVMATPALMSNALKPPQPQRPEKVMHKITCSDCGKEDSLPFKPSADRPVYCKECFSLRKKGGGHIKAESGYPNIAPALNPVKEETPMPKAKKKPAPAKKTAIKKKATPRKK